jgi:hypothetical protein
MAAEEELRRWVGRYRAAQQRELEEAPVIGPRPQAAIASALALVALAGRLHGWPVAADGIDRRDDAIALDRWDRLRAVLLRRERTG